MPKLYKHDGITGCVTRRKTRSGHTVGLFQAQQAGLEEDTATPWATVCEDHSGIVCHFRLKDAQSFLSHPEEWCPGCQNED